MRKKEHRTITRDAASTPRTLIPASRSTWAGALPTVAMLGALMSSLGCGQHEEAIAADPVPVVAEPPAPAPSSSSTSKQGMTSPETFEELALPPTPPPPPPPTKVRPTKAHIPPKKFPVHLDGDVSSVKLIAKPTRLA